MESLCAEGAPGSPLTSCRTGDPCAGRRGGGAATGLLHSPWAHCGAPHGQRLPVGAGRPPGGSWPAWWRLACFPAAPGPQLLSYLQPPHPESRETRLLPRATGKREARRGLPGSGRGGRQFWASDLQGPQGLLLGLPGSPGAQRRPLPSVSPQK